MLGKAPDIDVSSSQLVQQEFSEQDGAAVEERLLKLKTTLESFDSIEEKFKQAVQIKKEVYNRYLQYDLEGENKRSLERIIERDQSVNEICLKGTQAAKDTLNEIESFLRDTEAITDISVWGDLKEMVRWYKQAMKEFTQVLQSSQQRITAYKKDNAAKEVFLKATYEEIITGIDVLNGFEGARTQINNTIQSIKAYANQMKENAITSHWSDKTGGLTAVITAIHSQSQTLPVLNGILAVSFTMWTIGAIWPSSDKMNKQIAEERLQAL